MKKLAGVDAVSRFQVMVIEKRVASVRRRTAVEKTHARTSRNKSRQFDKNEDGKYSTDEVAELAKAARPARWWFSARLRRKAIDMAQFTSATAYDPSGKVLSRSRSCQSDWLISPFAATATKTVYSPEEIEEYIPRPRSGSFFRKAFTSAAVSLIR